MLLGMSLPQAGEVAPRAEIARVAREAEAIGLDSLWVLDRLLRPVRPISRGPGAPAEPLPKFYANVFDPTRNPDLRRRTDRAGAARHERDQRALPPARRARQAAGHARSVERRARDRRVGTGLDAGRVRRGRRADVAARRGHGGVRRGAARGLGTGPVSYNGRFYQIPESDIGPKPAQVGGIPILIGCYAPAAIARAGQIADGLNPFASTWEQLSAMSRPFARRRARQGATSQPCPSWPAPMPA